MFILFEFPNVPLIIKKVQNRNVFFREISRFLIWNISFFTWILFWSDLLLTLIIMHEFMKSCWSLCYTVLSYPWKKQAHVCTGSCDDYCGTKQKQTTFFKCKSQILSSPLCYLTPDAHYYLQQYWTSHNLLLICF